MTELEKRRLLAYTVLVLTVLLGISLGINAVLIFPPGPQL